MSDLKSETKIKEFQNFIINDIKIFICIKTAKISVNISIIKCII